MKVKSQNPENCEHEWEDSYCLNCGIYLGEVYDPGPIEDESAITLGKVAQHECCNDDTTQNRSANS
jgi:hypothetical protein